MVKKKRSIIKILVGLGLIAFAIIPTPDDITIISPVLAFTGGTKLLVDGLK